MPHPWECPSFLSPIKNHAHNGLFHLGNAAPYECRWFDQQKLTSLPTKFTYFSMVIFMLCCICLYMRIYEFPLFSRYFVYKYKPYWSFTKYLEIYTKHYLFYHRYTCSNSWATFHFQAHLISWSIFVRLWPISPQFLWF